MHLALGIVDGAAAFWGVIESFLLVVLVISVLAVLLVLLKKRPEQKEPENNYTMMSKILQDTLSEFGDKIENSLKDTIDSFGNKLTGVVMEVNLSSKVLDDTVDKFDQTIKNFAENVKNITEFNSKLGDNIEKMDSSYKNLTETLASTSKTVVDNYGSVETLSKDIKYAADEMTSYSKQVVQDLGSIVAEVKGSVSSIKDLGEVLKNDLSARSQEAKDYQENINQLIEKVSGDISILGHTTVTAFSKSIDESVQATSQKVAQDFGKIAGEVEGAVTSIKDLSEVLKNDFSVRSQEAKEYQENIKKLMEKMNDEISILGQKTVTAFSQGIEEGVQATSQKAVQDFTKIAAEIEASVTSIKDLSEVLKNDLGVRSKEAKEYQENITKLMLKVSGEMSVLGQNTTNAFSQSLEDSGQAISQKVAQSMDDVFKGIFTLLDDLKENEKLLAKTIVMLPNQVITYNETAANKVGIQLDEIKRLFRNNNGF
ncbi:hypothetical protein [Acetivibrio cellulolyticus]|uniref:hypothetical protein n=1 Tax=Acetivibrio cellulolyticus TaxID=35830 RepID=UPI0001E2BDB8|nr:hypothetical protein [Acetivibrio cellulolyticus]